MQEHDPIALDLDDERFVDKPATGAFGECVAEQEVMVTVDQIDGNAGRDRLGECGFDARVGRTAVVVAEPLIEEIAKDVEPIRPPHGAGENAENASTAPGRCAARCTSLANRSVT